MKRNNRRLRLVFGFVQDVYLQEIEAFEKKFRPFYFAKVYRDSMGYLNLIMLEEVNEHDLLVIIGLVFERWRHRGINHFENDVVDLDNHRNM